MNAGTARRLKHNVELVLTTMIQRRLSRPSTAVIIMAFLFVIRMIAYSQTDTALSTESTLSTLSQIIGVATSIGVFVMFLAGLAWFVFRGKDIESLSKKNASLRDDNEDLRTKNAELKADKLSLTEKRRKLKLARIRDRKLIHRLLAKTEGLEGLDDDEKLLLLGGDDDDDDDEL